MASLPFGKVLPTAVYLLNGPDFPCPRRCAPSPDAHWMVDAGLWTVEPKGGDWLVRVAKETFQESPIDGRTLLGREGHPLVFHPQARLRPGSEFLEWHRKDCYLGAA